MPEANACFGSDILETLRGNGLEDSQGAKESKGPQMRHRLTSMMGQVQIRIVAASLLAVLPLAGEPFRGRILTDDGMPLPEATAVVLECGQSGQAVVPVDEAGWFEFDGPWGQTGCVLETSAPGYRTHLIETNDLPGDPRIPAIVMYRLGKGQGQSLSALHLAAPPRAVESYHAAVREMRRGPQGDPEAILDRLEEAVRAYPDYAQAWFEIGRMRLAQGSGAGAIGAFREAVRADPWFVSPYEPLILLLRAAGNVAEASHACQGLRKINPALPGDCGMD